VKKGKVFLVGAGPGAPDLITVRGLECIRKADVLVYDRLVNRSLICHAPPHAELIFAGKSASHHALEQDAINQILLRRVRKGKRVVRLKGGDPFIFGRGGEEALFLADQGIPVKIIPGLSAALAVPGAASIPLTHRKYASSLAVLTGHRRRDGKVPVTRADTLVYLMPVTNLEQIVEKIIGAGVFPRETPCMLVENGTKREERFVSGCLDNIAKKAREQVVRPPAILIVGEVVKLRDRITKPFGEIRQKVTRLQGYSKQTKTGVSQEKHGKTVVPSTQRS